MDSGNDRDGPLPGPCFHLLTLTGTALLVLRSADGATLTAVPMQGGMMMPMLSYSASDGRIHALLDPAIPQLTPLLIRNPSDGFSPDDPWYLALDPRRQGLAFSRRYGFVMDTVTDPLPKGTTIWLRKLSGPAELVVYRTAGSVPKAFEPIFGTAGSSSSMAWSGMIFHPAFTAPPGTNSYTATCGAMKRRTLRDWSHSGSLPAGDGIGRSSLIREFTARGLLQNRRDEERSLQIEGVRR
ncbi:MAG: hypothetical protein AB7O66_16640 [Limisphaerales bacterium]